MNILTDHPFVTSIPKLLMSVKIPLFPVSTHIIYPPTNTVPTTLVTTNFTLLFNFHECPSKINQFSFFYQQSNGKSTFGQTQP